MEINEVQQQLFQEIKHRLPPDASVVDEVALQLGISTDSAYRRMRGEKSISFEELYKLVTHYSISLDQMMQVKQEGFLFQGNLLNPKTHRYDAHLKGILQSMTYFNTFKEKKEFYYLGKDLPVFYNSYFRELAAFKYFFWMSTLVFFPEFRNKKISFDDFPDELFELGQKSLVMYNQMDSFEIWNLESLNSTLHQIEYYIDNDLFRTDEDAVLVYDSIEKVLKHIEEQAKSGFKFDMGDPQKTPLGRYNAYFNEIVLLDNSMMVILDDKKMSMILHCAINYMITRDVHFTENHYNYIQNLIRRSTQISDVSEKERNSFFRRIHERIERRRASLKV